MLAHDDKNVRRAIEECEYNDARDPIISFKCDDVKWYTSYPDVQAHTFIYQNAHELKMGSYRFMSVGEDGQEDFDEETLHDGHDLYDYVYAVHTLNTNF